MPDPVPNQAEPVEVDLYEISDEDFLKQFEAAKAAAPDDGQPPRDDQGRFVARTAPTTPLDPPAATDEEHTYRRVIDLKDGSGVQVFEADSPEELINKLATAQEHATRKIKELTAKPAPAATPTPQETAVDADADWLLGQEFMTAPTKAFQKLFKQQTGMTIEEFKTKNEKVTRDLRDREEEQNGDAFVESHPEYIPNDFNSKKILKYLATYKMEGTPENIEQAFTDLKEGGLLQLKTEETHEAPPQHQQQPPARIAPNGQQVVVVRKKAASGLSARTASATVPEPTVEDLYDMPMNEFLKLGGQHSDF